MTKKHNLADKSKQHDTLAAYRANMVAQRLARQEKILALCVKAITTQEIADCIGIKRGTAQDYMQELQKEGRIVRFKPLTGNKTGGISYLYQVPKESYVVPVAVKEEPKAEHWNREFIAKMHRVLTL